MLAFSCIKIYADDLTDITGYNTDSNSNNISDWIENYTYTIEGTKVKLKTYIGETIMATAKKLPSGSYRVRVYVGASANGKKKYKSITAPTKKEAERLNKKVKKSKLLFGNHVQ